MVATVDGRASVAGRTAPISSLADRQLFHALRTRVDAVMVGAGTLRAERYGRIVPDPQRREQRVAAGLEADPLAIVVSGRLDLPADLPLLHDPSSRVLVVTAVETALEGCAAEVSYLRGAPIDLAAALAEARARARRAIDPLRGRPQPERVAVRRGPRRRALPHARADARGRGGRADDHRRRAA